MSSLEKSSKTTKPTLVSLVELLDYNNRTVVKHYGNLTLQKALAAKSPSIGRLSLHNENKAIRCVTNLFKSVALYFDTVLTQEKAEVIASEILYKYEYRNLKLEDLVVICNRLKEAEIYKLSVARILREINAYSKEREALAIRNSKESKVNMNADLEERLKKNYHLTPDAEKLEAKRNAIQYKFKK